MAHGWSTLAPAVQESSASVRGIPMRCSGRQVKPASFLGRGEENTGSCPGLAGVRFGRRRIIKITTKEKDRHLERGQRIIDWSPSKCPANAAVLCDAAEIIHAVRSDLGPVLCPYHLLHTYVHVEHTQPQSFVKITGRSPTQIKDRKRYPEVVAKIEDACVDPLSQVILAHL